MKRLRVFLVAMLLSFLLIPGIATATPFPNPNPTVAGDDLDDSGIFIHDPQVVSLELIDVGPLLGVGGAEFGFFFAGSDVSDPANLFTIFETTDQDPDPNGPKSVAQFALIDFTSNEVIDGDQSMIQNSFSGSGNIGFYLTPDPAFSSFYGIPGTLFTDSTLNPGGVDYVGTFPILGDTSLVLQFLFTNPATATLDTLSFEVVSGVTPVPEPATFLLLLTGLFPLGRAILRKSK